MRSPSRTLYGAFTTEGADLGPPLLLCRHARKRRRGGPTGKGRSPRAKPQRSQNEKGQTWETEAIEETHKTIATTPQAHTRTSSHKHARTHTHAHTARSTQHAAHSTQHTDPRAKPYTAPTHLATTLATPLAAPRATSGGSGGSTRTSAPRAGGVGDQHPLLQTLFGHTQLRHAELGHWDARLLGHQGSKLGEGGLGGSPDHSGDGGPPGLVSATQGRRRGAWKWGRGERGRQPTHTHNMR
jgi:hypothetical protein